jgi:hypothetical protein
LGYSTSTLKLLFVFLFLILITSVPSIQSQSPVQPSNTVSSQAKQIADKVATANPGINATFVEQILIELTRQSAHFSNQANVLDETLFFKVNLTVFAIFV